MFAFQSSLPILICFSAKVSHRLTLLYLANDVIQNAKKKNIPHYVSGFSLVLREAVALLNDEKVKPNVLRVLSIWQQRNVYEKEFVNDLKELLSGSLSAVPINSRIVAEFKLSSLLKPIEDLKEVERMSRALKEAVNGSSFNVQSIDALNNLKDKSHGEQTSREYDDASKVLEDEIHATERELAARTVLLEQLEKSQIFYETQKEETRIITNAYKNFGSRVLAVKKQLATTKDSLPSPPNVPTPSPVSSTGGLASLVKLSSQDDHSSSLDQRLNSLMQGIISGTASPTSSQFAGIPTAGIPLPPEQHPMGHVSAAQSGPPAAYYGNQPRQAPQHSSMQSGNHQRPYAQAAPYDPYSAGNTAFSQSTSAYHPIQSVVSSRATAAPDHHLHSNHHAARSHYEEYQPTAHENFELADMDLGSDEDESHSRAPYIPSNNLKVIQTQRQVAPEGPQPPPQNQQYNPLAHLKSAISVVRHEPAPAAQDSDWRQKPSARHTSAYQPETEAMPLGGAYAQQGHDRKQSFRGHTSRPTHPRRDNNNFNRY